MWVKLIGSALVITSCAMIGFEIARRFAERPRQLRQFQSGLQMLETHIVYRATPLSEALDQIGKMIHGTVGDFFTAVAELLNGSDCPTTADAWRKALLTYWSTLCLQQTDQELLMAFGVSLGGSDRADQVKYLKLVQEQLAVQEQQARDQQDRQAKMWRYLGVYGGIAVVVFLL